MAPQGFLGSGDHYTRTTNGIFDEKVKIAKSDVMKRGGEDIWECPITKTQVPMKRCIDDTLTWTDTFEKAVRQVWSILYWGAESGIVFNPDKLVIGKRRIKIFGFNIDSKGIHPTKEMKDAITGFELPSTIKMMRAFMGLIAQVTWTLDSPTRKLMGEVRTKLQRPKTKGKNLTWTNEEVLAFNKLKLAAAEAMESGIERMIKQGTSDKDGHPLVLTSDWSRKGTGFQLHIVTCDCHEKKEGNFRHNC